MSSGIEGDPAQNRNEEKCILAMHLNNILFMHRKSARWISFTGNAHGPFVSGNCTRMHARAPIGSQTKAIRDKTYTLECAKCVSKKQTLSHYATN